MKKLWYGLTAAMTLGMSGMAFADGEAAQGQSIWQMVIMIGVAVAFFYFIVLRPERKRRKAMEEQRSSMQKGDEVTAMGIRGTIAKVEEETVIIKLYDGAKMELLKAAINEVRPGTPAKKTTRTTKAKAEKEAELAPEAS